MKNIKSFSSFNEAIITPSDFTEMIDELRDSLLVKEEEFFRTMPRRPMGRMDGPGMPPMGGMPPMPGLEIDEVNDITNSYNVYFEDYDTFYDGLPDDLKRTAPPRRGSPIFGYVSENQQIRIVLTGGKLRIMDLGFLNHMAQHESIHIGQRSRRNLPYSLPDPKNQKLYFSDKDEIMAFSQSIVDMMKTDRFPIRNLEDLERYLKTNRLWSDIKRVVDTDVKNRYLKYIYVYLKEEVPSTKKEPFRLKK
jgi:hypothetical protein